MEYSVSANHVSERNLERGTPKRSIERQGITNKVFLEVTRSIAQQMEIKLTASDKKISKMARSKQGQSSFDRDSPKELMS